MHKNFSFKGVVRSNDNILAYEGECMELVNLRMVNGSLKPIPETDFCTSGNKTVSVIFPDKDFAGDACCNIDFCQFTQPILCPNRFNFVLVEYHKRKFSAIGRTVEPGNSVVDSIIIPLVVQKITMVQKHTVFFSIESLS